MNPGYDQPLYIMPFDHRSIYAQDVFGLSEPRGAEEIATMCDRKHVIYEAYQHALAAGVPRERSGILIDEQFGADILREARHAGLTTAMPLEKQGQLEFDFEYGDDFAKNIETFEPTFTKVLVRQNPAGDAELNRRQTARLKRLSDYLHGTNRRFMCELIVPAEPAQLAALQGDRQAFDVELRPRLMVEAMHALQDAGVEPDVWKIEGLDRREDCVKIAAAVRRHGRDRVGCVVLGRGEDESRVVTWLRTAAGVPGFIGFAVGRSTFLKPMQAFRLGQMTRAAAATAIAEKLQHWIDVFEGGRAE
jgi:myo-inositol catabolism protein IolC